MSIGYGIMMAGAAIGGAYLRVHKPNSIFGGAMLCFVILGLFVLGPKS